MKRYFLTLVLALSLTAASTAWCQYIESVEEITSGNFFGYGARQMAMGGAGLMTNDGTALFYNPANLARIPRIEFLFGMSHQKYRDESSLRPVRKIVNFNSVIPEVDIYSGRFESFVPLSGSMDDSKSNTRINAGIISIPYPTYRGSLVLGIGVVRSADFDRIFSLYHRDTSSAGSITASGNEFQSGGLYQWGFGAGIDLSPKISCGATVYLFTGKHEYNWEYNLDSLQALTYHSEQYIEDSYLGIGGKIGLTVQMSPYFGLGLAMETPAVLSVDENSNSSYTLADTGYSSDESANYVEYDVKKPFVFSAGVMSRYKDATLEMDIDYTDWSQLSYGGNVEMEKENSKIKSYYRDALRFRAGGEYVFPALGLSLRGGYFTDPLPFKEEFQNKSRYGYTFGLGLLIDQVMTIDLAYIHGSYSRNSDFLYSTVYNNEVGRYHYLVVDEDISYNRLFLTAAYRF
jgi:Outer membrane protein transport protein (OMPP1/FadL/TodX)